MEALREKELPRQDRTASSRTGGSSAGDFLKTVALSNITIWGSSGERAQCRRRAFAHQTRFGQPALYVTLTPNVADSFVMAQYCGLTSVETLFDAALDDLPGLSTLHAASLRNDVASARLFARNIKAFIEHVLGISPKHLEVKPFDGLFGKVKAYFGMVETQGGGTLHVHFLVRLIDSPPNTDAFDRAVCAYGNLYYRDVEAFADSIVSISIPFIIAESSCVFCGRSYAGLHELPIPPEAYEEPNKLQRGRNALGEPALVRCSGCGTELSSQHVTCRLLLDHRPSLWPPPMLPYTTTELESAIRMETPCRGSVAAAKCAIYRRDVHLFLAQEDTGGELDNGAYAEYLRGLNRTPHRLERREDNDTFRDDTVIRVLAMLPPSVDDER